MYSFSYLESACCSMSSSNCCFLACIQVSQEAGQVAWYSHLFQNFPQFIVIHTVKRFGIVNKAEIDVFLEVSCFFDDPLGEHKYSVSRYIPKCLWSHFSCSMSHRFILEVPCPGTVLTWYQQNDVGPDSFLWWHFQRVVSPSKALPPSSVTCSAFSFSWGAGLCRRDG